MSTFDRIQLAHEHEFRLGLLTVVPSRRELVRDDGARSAIEHRVMQVLIALARAKGAIITRDELTMMCWDGRVVGEDAINRVISRLRKAASDIGAGSFAIETITKIGYRLVSEDNVAAEEPRATSTAHSAPLPVAAPARRRFMVAAGLGGLAVATVGGGILYRSLTRPETPPEVDALLAQAWQAWTQGTREGNSQAIGLYRRAIDLAPNHADAWGYLACAYGDRAHGTPVDSERVVLRERAKVAGERALAIDPKNALGRAAIAYARPIIGNWLIMERAFRQGLEDRPGTWLIVYSLALLLTRVGRHSESASLFGQLSDRAPTATQYFFHIEALWGAGRLDEAERLLGEAVPIYGSHPRIWGTRFNMLLYSGRPDAAIALIQDRGSLPADISPEDLGSRLEVAKALATGDPADADAVIAVHGQYARDDAWQAVDAMQFASALGRIDDAFAIADAYFFSRGFAIPDSKYATSQPHITTLNARDTRFLFLPAMRAARADARFARLVGDLGLDRYWRSAGAQPDYRRA